PAATPPAAAAAPQGGPPLSEQGLFDEINAYVGLESVKTEFKKLFNLARLSQERLKAGLPAERGTLHLVFSGNPGTGKTSIARLVGKMYHQMGLLPTDRVVECSRKDLVAEYVGQTAKTTQEKIEEAKGGVLFIDEVYTLSQPDSPKDFGHEAIAVLLEMMENGRDDLCVIIAGYSDEMRKFFEDNDGLKSRFPTIIEFPDYTAPELMEIITRLLDARKMVLDDAARARLLAVVTDIHSRRDRKFGNGREMRNLAEAICKKQGVRLMTLSAAQRTPTELQRITEEDIPDERVRTVAVNEQELFDEINAYVGLDSVKAEFRNLLNLARIGQERLKAGLPAERGALHLVFSGNPGTGKTSIARLVGKMYHQLGLLRSDRVVECSRKDLVAQYVGQTAKATQEKIEEAKGGVLFIDEVYTLSRPDDPKDFGHEAIAVLLEMMENGRDDLCVIIAGYSDKMRQFFENNDGLKSRFPTEIEFPDYTAPELMEIVTRVLDAKKMVLDDAARARLLAVVTDIHSRRDEKFGNGREMRNLAEAICKQQGARLMTIPAAQRTATELQCITEGDIPDERVKGAKDVESVMEHLDGLIGLEKVKKEIRGLINIVKLNRRKIAQGRKPLPVSLHMVFEGNPGTGKTTVARLMGEIFRALGVLAKGQLVSANRSSLVTGRPANATKEVVRSALDGVLFIDEAYTLVKWGENDIGVEAINQLLEDMETYRDRLAVIVAGYTEPMKEFLAANPGMKSRFTRTITFDDYTPEQLLLIFEQRCIGHEMTLTPEAREVLLALLERIHANRKEDFGNARDMRTLFETTMGRLAARVNADASGTVSDSEILAVDIPEG
ncbi:AAA family ATPase, partial [Novacetimonas maltaceti]